MKSVAKAITRASSSAATRNGKLRLFTADSSETETYYGNFRSKADEEFVQIQRPSSIPPTILERTNLGPATQQLTPNSDSLSLSSQVDYTLFESSIFFIPNINFWKNLPNSGFDFINSNLRQHFGFQIHTQKKFRQNWIFSNFGNKNSIIW